MKKLVNIQCSVKDGKATITGNIVEAGKGEFKFPVQQTTITLVNSENPRWIRHLQISTEATFVKSSGVGFAIPHVELMEISNACEPKSSFPPVLKGKPSLTVEFNSELELTFQWEASDSLEKGKQNWAEIVGQTTVTLDPSTVKKGQFVRCIGKNAAGDYVTPPIPI